MAVTVSNSNYNGSVLDVIYSVFDTDNEVAAQALAVVETGIRKKKSLPVMSTTDSPFGDYTAGAPGTDTATTTYHERYLEVEPMVLFEKFLPEDFDDVWEPFQPDGDFTNAMQNPAVLTAILELHKNSMGRQISKLFFQGDKTLGAGQAMNKFNGIVTRALLDVNVPKVTPAGAITAANVVSIITDIYSNIPNKFINDPEYKIIMNMTDYRLLQLANLALKDAFEGVLGLTELNTFLGTRIIGLASMKKDYILCGIATTNRATSNLFLGVLQDEKSEAPRIEKMANGSKYFFIRVDVKADANYREATELLLYKPA